MFHYAVDVRFIADESLTPGELQAVACEELKLCESVGCYRCGLGDREEVTCNQLESAEAGYELQVSASEGPQTWTGAPGWMLVSWFSRGALHFELTLDEMPAVGLMSNFFTRLRTLGICSVSCTNRAATPLEHPASFVPQFRGEA